VLQTVFLRLFRRAENANVESSVENSAPGGVRNAALSGVHNQESYLRRAAVNAALDVIRSRQANPSVELVDLPGRQSHGETAELRDALARAMGKLQPRWAEVFALRFLEGLSNREIAQTLGISQVSVAVIIYRTRQQLRKELSEYLGDRS
jgi:RNA polymerase sigma-70 factor, ECF subfamily